MNETNKRIIIVGATSGIGYEVASLYIEKGYQVGVAGRRTERLEILRAKAPRQVFTQYIDVTSQAAPEQLMALIERMGGMDIFLLCAGIGHQNRCLTAEIEMRTLQTNVEGFTRMVLAAYHYFSGHGGGHIAAISSIRLFVVMISPPESSFLTSLYRKIAPQPPGPGFPEQAPSV